MGPSTIWVNTNLVCQIDPVEEVVIEAACMTQPSGRSISAVGASWFVQITRGLLVFLQNTCTGEPQDSERQDGGRADGGHTRCSTTGQRFVVITEC